MAIAGSSKSKRGARSKLARDAAATYSKVASLAEITADSLEGVFGKIDGEVFSELRQIANHIETLRREIATLQPARMHRVSIPAAGAELDAIVSTTESASNIILECAEQVMAADARDAKHYKTFVEERMLRIFEACSFQDLTGQRIAKVVDTLKQIETRVARFAKVARAEDGGKLRLPPNKANNSQEAIDRIISAGASRQPKPR
jgi:chemotaxis protein CheZ